MSVATPTDGPYTFRAALTTTDMLLCKQRMVVSTKIGLLIMQSRFVCLYVFLQLYDTYPDQVGRMMCGGIVVVGMYSLSGKPEKDAMAALRKLAVAACKAADVSSDAAVFGVVVNAKNKKMTCKSFGLSSGSDLKPVDIKSQDCCKTLKGFR